MTIATERRCTPEDLLAMPEGERYELVDGRLVERNMGSEADWIAGNLFGLLFIWNRTRKCGWLLHSESSYQCFPGKPGQVRRPDLSFIRSGRLATRYVPRGHVRAAPDLAAEV